MANESIVDDIRERVEDEIDLTVNEIIDALKALRKTKKRLEETGQSPRTLTLVIALISYLNKLLQRLTEMNLAKLGQSQAIQNAIKTLKTERKGLDKLVDQGLANAKRLERATKIAKALGKGVGMLEKVAKKA